MKKVILTAIVAVASLSASAQVWIGGDLGFGFQKRGQDGAKTESTVKIAPEIGYMINDNFGVYADINFTTESNKYEEEEYAEKAATSFGFDVAARYIFAKTGIASFFVDGGFGIDFYNNNGGSVFDIKVQPGVKFDASEKVSIVAKLGGIRFASANKKAQENFPKTAFGLNVANTDLSLGVYYNF